MSATAKLAKKIVLNPVNEIRFFRQMKVGYQSITIILSGGMRYSVCDLFCAVKTNALGLPVK